MYICSMKTTKQNLNSFKLKGTSTYVIGNRAYEIFQAEDESWGCNFYEDGQLIDVSGGNGQELLLREVKEEIVDIANYYNN